jgi:hypothetical protein
LIFLLDHDNIQRNIELNPFITIKMLNNIIKDEQGILISNEYLRRYVSQGIGYKYCKVKSESDFKKH